MQHSASGGYPPGGVEPQKDPDPGQQAYNYDQLVPRRQDSQTTVYENMGAGIPTTMQSQQRLISPQTRQVYAQQHEDVDGGRAAGSPAFVQGSMQEMPSRAPVPPSPILPSLQRAGHSVSSLGSLDKMESPAANYAAPRVQPPAAPSSTLPGSMSRPELHYGHVSSVQSPALDPGRIPGTQSPHHDASHRFGTHFPHHDASHPRTGPAYNISPLPQMQGYPGPAFAQPPYQQHQGQPGLERPAVIQGRPDSPQPAKARPDYHPYPQPLRPGMPPSNTGSYASGSHQMFPADAASNSVPPSLRMHPQAYQSQKMLQHARSEASIMPQQVPPAGVGPHQQAISQNQPLKQMSCDNLPERRYNYPHMREVPVSRYSQLGSNVFRNNLEYNNINTRNPPPVFIERIFDSARAMANPRIDQYDALVVCVAIYPL